MILIEPASGVTNCSPVLDISPVQGFMTPLPTSTAASKHGLELEKGRFETDVVQYIDDDEDTAMEDETSIGEALTEVTSSGQSSLTDVCFQFEQIDLDEDGPKQNGPENGSSDTKEHVELVVKAEDRKDELSDEKTGK